MARRAIRRARPYKPPRSGRCSGNVTTWAPDRVDPDYQVISPTNQVISPNSHFYWSPMAGARSALTCLT
jgi:hypothetical protein